MSFSDYLPSIVALVGIPAAAGFAWWRENWLRDRQERREDLIRAQQHEREGKLLQQNQDDWIKQRWWERKADAYTRIVQGLWHIVDEDRTEYELEIREREGRRTLTDEEKRQMRLERDELRQAADVGALVISDKASAALKHYFETTARIVYKGDYLDVVEKRWAAAASCLEAIRECAVEDLRVGRLELQDHRVTEVAESTPSKVLGR